MLGLTFTGLITVAPTQAEAAQSWSCRDNGGTGCIAQYGYTGQPTWGMGTCTNNNNCTNYAAFRLQQMGATQQLNTMAYYWATQASSLSQYTVSSAVSTTPVPGDIIQWNIGKYDGWDYDAGHVAVVEWVDGNSIGISESACAGFSALRVIAKNASVGQHYSNIIHFKSNKQSNYAFTDGTFIASPNGWLFVMAGGAPTYVSSWANMGARKGKQVYVTSITQAKFNSLPPYPADGTYVMATAANQWVNGQPQGRVYVFAGGAPIHVGDWNRVGGTKTFTVVDQAAIDPDVANGQVGETAINAIYNQAPWNHVRRYPANGTFVKGYSNGFVYKITNGIPTVVSSWTGTPTPVDHLAVTTNAGKALPWNHIKANPNPVQTACSAGCVPLYRIAGPNNTHLYTINESEKNTVSSWSGYTLEGIIGYVPTSANNFNSSTQKTVYRFSKSGGVHGYNTSTTLSGYTLEGSAFTAWTGSATGLTAVYRFVDLRNGDHFLTTNATEANTVKTWTSTYRYDGIAYYISATNG